MMLIILNHELNKSWLIGSVSGPIIEDQLFFYGSFYQPEEDRVNKETAYGETKDYSSERKEYFGKLTYAPIDDLLLNFSYRTSDKTEKVNLLERLALIVHLKVHRLIKIF